MTVVRESSPGRYEVAANIKTQVGAKTIALDPKTHRLYLSAATRAAAPAATPGVATKKATRPGYEPGSFVVLVVGE